MQWQNEGIKLAVSYEDSKKTRDWSETEVV